MQYKRGVWAFAGAVALVLSGCGGGSSDFDDGHGDDDHDHEHIETAGRLVVLEPGSTQVHVINLDKNVVEQSHALDYPASAVYASPGQRYAVLMQRPQNQVQFLDGGIWMEDHGDHLHDYMQASALLNLRLAGVAPTHYQSHGERAALFFDGNGPAGDKASFALLSDTSIGSGSAAPVLARHTLDTHMHGTAEPRGDWLLATWRDPEASGTLPSQVELYHRHNDHFHQERRFDVQCPGLHGSYSNAHYSVFGCEDGVLVVKQDGDNFSASKIAHDVRISTIIGNEDMANFVGFGSGGAVFEINPSAGTIAPINWAEGRTRRAHAIDADGDNLLLLDDAGTVHILDTDDWRKRAAIQAIQTMPAAAPYPAFAVSSAEDKAWLSDPQGRRLHLIDLDGARIDGGVALNFHPTAMVWLGMPEHEHGDHDHHH